MQRLWRGRAAIPYKILLCLLVAVTVSSGRTTGIDEVALTVPYWTAGLVADSHYDTFPAGEQAPWEPDSHWLRGQQERTTWKKRRYDIARDKMDESIDVFNRVEQMTLVVNLGDIVNNDLMWNLKPILDSFNRAKAPKFNILGNHDLRAHNDRFGKHNTSQHQWAKDKLGLGHPTRNGDRWYYRIDHPPFIFLFFDSMVMEGAQKDKSKKEAHVIWALHQCDEAQAKGYAVVIFAHISIGIETNPLGRVLKHYPHIVAAFFGHEHKGGYIVQRGIHCVILQGQIETMVNAFAVVEAFPDRLEVSGFGRVPSYTLKFKPETVEMLKGYSGPKKTDIFSQGNQPLPPDQLWPAGEVLQKHPPLNLHLPGYKKPVLPATEPNGKTRFILKEYNQWPHRILTSSPEEINNLMDYNENQKIKKERQKREGGSSVVKPPPATVETLVMDSPSAAPTALKIHSAPRVAVPKDTKSIRGDMIINDGRGGGGGDKLRGTDTSSFLTPLPPHRYHSDEAAAASIQSSLVVMIALPVMLTVFLIFRFVKRRRSGVTSGSTSGRSAA